MFLLISSFPLLPSRRSSLLFVGCPDAVVQYVARFVDYCLSLSLGSFQSGCATDEGKHRTVQVLMLVINARLAGDPCLQDALAGGKNVTATAGA